MSHADVHELREGDLVSIVGDTDQGLIRARAVVLGCSSPDWYVGRLEDGNEVDFRIDQVEVVEAGDERSSYEMGGFLDWFKKKPDPRRQELIPIEPAEPVIYVSPTGVARYEEPKRKKKGFFRPIKEAVKSFFTTPGTGDSIFDIFKTTTALTPATEKKAVKFKKVPSLFSQFVPPEWLFPSITEKLTSIIPFDFVKPSREPVPYEERKAKQQELFEGMFEESKEEESIEKGFDFIRPSGQVEPGIKEPFEESEIVPESDILVPKAMYGPYRGGETLPIVALPMPPREELLPSPEFVARGLLGWMDPKWLNDFKRWSENHQRAWRNSAGNPVLKIPFYQIGLHDGHPDSIEGIAIFLQIPWEEFERRFAQEGEEGGELTEEIILPSISIINEAFSLIMPSDVPGRVEAQFSLDCGCLELVYVDVARDLTSEEVEVFEEELQNEGFIEEAEEDNGEEFVKVEPEKVPARARKTKRKTKKAKKR